MQVVGVSQDGLDGAESFAREFDLTMPILVDGERYPVSREYDLVAVPTLYLIDPEGRIVRSGAGFNKEELDRMAEDLASSVGAPKPALYREGEAIPDAKPG